ncbi:hypothetical protein SKAU_G00351060 [Synaphobranchus kaupii]|uniref:E3 ubiquitin-protein ligase Arkadia N-terminal domain-containing protein n=1 Tax=Synaphobranchus kaupii TaxID=118154 RepID=A0A9Q1EKM3_SYNKA|nr:hypothetical protein SKAU_G00351060 [Synaphobranchus kaupii]
MGKATFYSPRRRPGTTRVLRTPAALAAAVRTRGSAPALLRSRPASRADVPLPTAGRFHNSKMRRCWAFELWAERGALDGLLRAGAAVLSAASTGTATMKSEVPSDAPGRHEHLKGALANPEPMEAAKSFPADMEVIGKVGSEFAPLCAEARHRPLREAGPGARRDTDRGLPARKKRKSQQAGPSDCALKEGRLAGGPLATPLRGAGALQGRGEDERRLESSFSECASSPSSSLRFGDSDTLSSSEEAVGGQGVGVAGGGVAGALQQRKAGAVSAGGGAAGVGLRPAAGRTRGSGRPQKWARPEPEPVLLKRPCLSAQRRPPHRKRFVKAGPGAGAGAAGAQRTPKQKERLQLQRRKREVIARRKYALLHSTSSSSEELSSESSSASSTEGEDELYVDVSSSSSQPGSAAMAAGKTRKREVTHYTF